MKIAIILHPVTPYKSQELPVTSYSRCAPVYCLIHRLEAWWKRTSCSTLKGGAIHFSIACSGAGSSPGPSQERGVQQRAGHNNKHLWVQWRAHYRAIRKALQVERERWRRTGLTSWLDRSALHFRVNDSGLGLLQLVCGKCVNELLKSVSTQRH